MSETDFRIHAHKLRIESEMAAAGIRRHTLTGAAQRRTDLTGKRFGRLVVKSFASGGRWTCLCDCGHTCEKRGDHLRSAPNPSCGCRRREHAARIGRMNLGAAA